MRASGANGTEGGEASVQLADRQASSSNAGPSHNSTHRSAAEPIRQHSIPEGNPYLATLVGHYTIPFRSHSLVNSGIAFSLISPCSHQTQGHAHTHLCMLQMVKCPDRKGVIAALAQLLYGLGCNILASEQFTAAEGVYFQRIRFDLSDIVVGTANVSVLERAVSEVRYMPSAARFSLV